MAKKLMHMERDLSQLNKEYKQDVHEIQQRVKDSDLILKNLRHQVEQSYASNEFKAQEVASNQADSLQSLQLRVDQQERLTRKVNNDLESQYAQVRDLNRQFQMQTVSRID